MSDVPEDAPRLTAWLDDDGEGDELHVRVSDGEDTYETVHSNLAMLLQNEQYLRQIQQSGLNLLSLYTAGEAASAEGAPVDGEGEEAVNELEV